MRKLNKAVAAVATLAIAASMAAPAFAAGIDSSAITGGTSHDILATYSKSETVYSVDISYNSMDFTYTEGSWSPATLKYTDGGWSAAQTVTVTNRSNAEITATAEAAIDKGVAGSANITAKVVSTDSDTIFAADDADPTAQGTPHSKTFSVSLDGAPTVRNWRGMPIGSVTVTIS